MTWTDLGARQPGLEGVLVPVLSPEQIEQVTAKVREQAALHLRPMPLADIIDRIDRAGELLDGSGEGRGEVLDHGGRRPDLAPLDRVHVERHHAGRVPEQRRDAHRGAGLERTVVGAHPQPGEASRAVGQDDALEFLPRRSGAAQAGVERGQQREDERLAEHEDRQRATGGQRLRGKAREQQHELQRHNRDQRGQHELETVNKEDHPLRRALQHSRSNEVFAERLQNRRPRHPRDDCRRSERRLRWRGSGPPDIRKESFFRSHWGQ